MGSNIFITLLFFNIYYVFADILVSLPNGKIRGHVLQSPGNINFYAFQSIPYAKPPLGNLRFQEPQPVENWEGILNTTTTSNRCYSVAKDTDDESEDCLYINVYTPILESENKTKLPVMVFIYGGGFRDGASAYSTYGPDYLIEQDVLVVSFNYRVGPFGFLSTGDEVVPGNAGLKDQLFALKWTNQNIGLFGGDSSKITIFGQSAGAASVCYHILSKQSTETHPDFPPLNQGTISKIEAQYREMGHVRKVPSKRQAVVDDDTKLNLLLALEENPITPAHPRPYGFQLASLISDTAISDDSNELLNFLVNVTAKEIDVASTTTTNLALPVLEYEHDGAFLTKKMYEQLASGDINRVPLLIGINSEESLSKLKDIESYYNEMASYDNDLTSLIPDDLIMSDSVNRTEVAEEIKRIYVEDGTKMQDNLGKILAYFSDNSYTRPIIKHAELQSNYTDVYFYQFSHKGPMGNTNISTLEGAEKVGHGEERHYYFRVQSKTYDNSDLAQFPASDVLTHYRIVRIWTDFAKTMNPTPNKTDLLQNIVWPKVEPKYFQYVDINDDLEIKMNPKDKRYNSWNEIYQKWGTTPFTTY
ncbi:hypothetical protein NQ318_010599 [Aromia moschata]|uniref:Carboxylic ester hydrolase n=1 Tax=Aromia moschata TaxID=1265417 RepID=A0AAV8XM45_9CUCU|nr:hypothetical protein NQ318_010599 [Aromia moschata]